MDLKDEVKDDDLPKPWETRPISIGRWRRHRETIMKWSHPGTRPDEWWIYERKLPQPDREANALHELGELSESELEVLMPEWREKYDQANAPGYTYGIGHKNPGDTFNSWIEGAAARRASYRLHGIPDAVIRKFDAERRRSK